MRAYVYTYEITWSKHGDRADDPPMTFRGVDYQVADGLHKIFVQAQDSGYYQLALTLRGSDVQMIRIIQDQT